MIRQLFSWFRTPSPEISESLWSAVIADLPFLHRLGSDERLRLRGLTADFLHRKEFSAASGLDLDDTICLSIAVQGCLPILNLGLDWYRGWVGIIVYPDEFVIPRQVADEDGVVHEYDEVASGEAWSGGPLLISWRDVRLCGDGYNVVIHEFAHKLDMLSGEVDGHPPLHMGMDNAGWHRILNEAYEDFCRRVDDGEDTEIDPYGAEHPGEFFAVLSECFFETPDVVCDEYPALYVQLAAFYRQDPAGVLDRPRP